MTCAWTLAEKYLAAYERITGRSSLLRGLGDVRTRRASRTFAGEGCLEKPQSATAG